MNFKSGVILLITNNFIIMITETGGPCISPVYSTIHPTAVHCIPFPKSDTF